MKELNQLDPEIRIINLETTITQSESFYPKGINYRMNPQNIEVSNLLKNKKYLVCSLANNHILDFERKGLLETIEVLKRNNIYFTGAGENIELAQRPVRIKNILIFSYGHINSGIPEDWQAKENQSGVNLIYDFSERTLNKIKENIEKYRRKEDVIIFSIHWGPNWGYEISEEERKFAHFLINKCGVDIIHGHSSHHFKGLEIYQNKLILYGCEDFINDYEGIEGYEGFRPDLALMYLIEIEKEIEKIVIYPFKIEKFRLNYPSQSDLKFVAQTLKRESVVTGDWKIQNHCLILSNKR